VAIAGLLLYSEVSQSPATLYGGTEWSYIMLFVDSGLDGITCLRNTLLVNELIDLRRFALLLMNVWDDTPDSRLSLHMLFFVSRAWIARLLSWFLVGEVCT